jgi:hypothetical protein
MNKLKVMTIVGTRPEIIKLSEVIKKCDGYFDHVFVHTGQNYDYTLNEVFFEDLGLRAPDYYLGVVGDDLGQTIGNIIAKSYALMCEARPDALLVLGDTNSALSVIAAKRLKIPFSIWKRATGALTKTCGRNQPQNRGSYCRREPALFRVCQAKFAGRGFEEGIYLCDRFADGGDIGCVRGENRRQRCAESTGS